MEITDSGCFLYLSADIQCQTDLTQKKHNRSAAITEKGQSDTGVGDGIGDNCNVQNHLDCQMSHDTGTDQGS